MSRLFVLVLSCVFTFTANAADQFPNLVGEWTGTVEGSIYGAGGHNPGDTSSHQFRVHKFVIHFIVEEQTGRSFHGRIVSDAYSEKMVGSVNVDGNSGVMADEDGTYQFRLIGDNQLNYCYTHSTKASLVAGCNTVQKKISK